MFDSYAYFKSREAAGGLPVYRVTGISKMEELVSDIRVTKFPCLVVDCGADGTLDLESGCADHGFYTIHLIDTVGERGNDMDAVCAILDKMFDHGKKIMACMKSESSDHSMPCYGFDPKSINYSRTGPIGMQAYGYTFNFVMVRDHER